MTSPLIFFIVLLLCLLAEGFFTGTEMAVVNADKLSLRSRARHGSKRARLVLSFLAKPGRFFSTTLLGTNLAVVTASVCTTYFINNRFGERYEWLALILSPVILILGELVPKSLFQHHADHIVLKTAYPLKLFGILFAPVIFILSRLTNVLLGSVTRRVGSETPIARDELEMLLKGGEEEISGGKAETSRKTIISRIFDLAEKRAVNIMRPLVDVDAIPITATREEAIRAFEEEGHSRLPVFRDRIFNIVGILTNIDLLMPEPGVSVKERMRPAYYVPEGMPLDELLVAMKKKGEPMVIVVDEFGGASGILTFEDLIEEVVGEIQDEYDTQPPLYYRVGKNRFLASGRLSILEANEKLKLDLPPGDYETVAGFLIHQLGRIPKSGTDYRFGKLRFLVHRANERAVQEMEIHLL